ncbi:Major facilitator superfamily [Trinorchestia longiramus]|nr:Major facilitator superfamily [Trinorchestia longiramus]
MSDKVPASTLRDKVEQIWEKIKTIPQKILLEPVMLLDGFCYSIMIVAVENIQMDKICLVNLNYTTQVCDNLSAYPEASLEHQKAFSVFGMWYGVLTAILPLFFVLFVGAWSDKYGRKPPLIAATVGHAMWALCYLMNAFATSWPVEMFFLAAILDTIGGGTVSFLTACNAYISDVTKESERTSRVGLANSIWFLGGPIGTLSGTYLYKYGGYLTVFGTSACLQVLSLAYIISIPESRGPFAQFDQTGKRIKKTDLTNKIINESVKSSETESKENGKQELNNNSNETDEKKIPLKKMFTDLVDYHRITDSFRSTFRKREGNARTFVLLLITCNLLRRLGRGAYMYLFTRRVLDWGPTDYGVWVSYKNLISALGSMVAVPILSTHVGLNDNLLALIGAFAATLDYLLYGLISSSAQFLIWIAPVGGLLVNSCVIAIRSMLSKFVPGDELGKVSAVMGALDGVMPMASFSLYTLVYKSSVHVFPGAQFLFGSGANLLCALIFIFIIYFTKSKSYTIDDLEAESPKEPVTLKAFRSLTRSAADDPTVQRIVMDEHSRLVVGVLAGENFHIASAHQREKNEKCLQIQNADTLKPLPILEGPDAEIHLPHYQFSENTIFENKVLPLASNTSLGDVFGSKDSALKKTLDDHNKISAIPDNEVAISPKSKGLCNPAFVNESEEEWKRNKA